jgi:hypothetical protein
VQLNRMSDSRAIASCTGMPTATWVCSRRSNAF